MSKNLLKKVFEQNDGEKVLDLAFHSEKPWIAAALEQGKVQM